MGQACNKLAQAHTRHCKVTCALYSHILNIVRFVSLFAHDSFIFDTLYYHFNSISLDVLSVYNQYFAFLTYSYSLVVLCANDTL